ncbi:hypothetical protein P154DRAFT_620838 [Amniculicola lignicola CBS 123094]|uniref:Alpha/beta hydrolase fold-3 domain-containing protein n=1 Tax=Amniculicola lignicola CBS 123094 TaxID=1392246 RepID=A0A6A5WHR7_9PLEO|nr:hypothetical protein P154DRAFT_620838 [Amniculicola lignicola CBS 123094]
MESTPTALLKFLLPKTPFILKTALWHTLSMSDTASHWDLRTELTVKVLRQMLGPDSETSTITKLQRLTTKDPGVKGKVWVCKVKCGVPGEDTLRAVLFRAIEELNTSGEVLDYERPDAVPMEAEWVGYRGDASVTDSTPEPADLSEKEKYENMMKETTSKVTVLYFHGGAMYLLDPATYRPLAGKIAQKTGGRVFNVRYRLAPQNPFPAAILDAFTAYLTLLYPPTDAPHDPVPASHIVFGGDSAGGMICTALLQLLLQMHRSNADSNSSLPTIQFHGRDVPVPLPAGLAITSPWLDATRSLPSIEALAKYDYLPTPSQTATMEHPPCPAWPTTPPRADLYTTTNTLTHPLVSPLAATNWTGAPPIFFSVGEEMLYDENAVLATRVARQGGKVVWREFQAMPHVFGMMIEWTAQAGMHLAEYTKFCCQVVDGGEGVETNGVVYAARGMGEKSVDAGGLSKMTEEQVREFMREGKNRIEKKFMGGVVEARPML